MLQIFTCYKLQMLCMLNFYYQKVERYYTPTLWITQMVLLFFIFYLFIFYYYRHYNLFYCL
jgi:hypothetical protein